MNFCYFSSIIIGEVTWYTIETDGVHYNLADDHQITPTWANLTKCMFKSHPISIP